MTSLVSVKIPNRDPIAITIDDVKGLEGYKDLNIDEKYGVVSIRPSKGLYAIRVIGEIGEEQRRKIKLRNGEIYSDPQISLAH